MTNLSFKNNFDVFQSTSNTSHMTEYWIDQHCSIGTVS
jgi:hypothetical protein